MKTPQTSSLKVSVGQLASGWDRLSAVLLDGCIVNIPTTLLFVWLLRTADIGSFFVVGIKVLILIITFGWLEIVYVVGLRARFQRTLGMFCVGLSLTSVDGKPLTWKAVAFRELIGKMASHYVLGWGFLGAWRHPQKQTWHDRLVDSLVVRTEARPTGLKVYLLVAAIIFQAALTYFLVRLAITSPVILGLFDMLKS